MSRTASYRHTLTILSGPNAGAQHDFEGKRLRIGPDGASDVVLDDFDGAPLDLAVSQGKLRVLTAREAVVLEGGTPCRPGKPAYAALPHTLTVGGTTQINVSCSVDSAARPKRTPARAVLAATVLAAALLLLDGVAPTGALNGALAGVREVQLSGGPVAAAIQPEVRAVAAPVPTVVPTPRRADAGEAERALRAALGEAGLADVVIAAEGGVIRLTGAATPEGRVALAALRRDYDRRYGAVAPLLVEVEEVADAAPLSVASVWLGATPEVVTYAGDVLRIGDRTPAGWEVVRIEGAAVHLARGPRVAVVEF